MAERFRQVSPPLVVRKIPLPPAAPERLFVVIQAVFSSKAWMSQLVLHLASSMSFTSRSRRHRWF